MTFIPDALREQAVCTTTDPEAFHDPALAWAGEAE